MGYHIDDFIRDNASGFDLDSFLSALEKLSEGQRNKFAYQLIDRLFYVLSGPSKLELDEILKYINQTFCFDYSTLITAISDDIRIIGDLSPRVELKIKGLDHE